MATIPQLGHVLISGKPYRIELSSYSGRDAVDFSPRGQVPGGGATYSQLGLYQPLSITDWRAGFGYQWHTNEAGYLSTAGNIDTRHEGIVMLWTDATQSDTDQHAKNGFLSARIAATDFLWGYHTKGARWVDSAIAAWSDADPVDTTEVKAMWWNGKYLFACPEGGRLYYSDTTDTGSDWTAGGGGDSSIDYNWLTHHDGFAYVGKDADGSGAGGNEVYYDDAIDLAGMYGDPTDDPSVIYVGVDGFETKGGVPFQGKLYFPRADGLYELLADKTGARKALDFSDVTSEDNFRSWCIFNNALYFPIRDVLYRWNGTSLAVVTPARLTDTFPYETYGHFDNFVVIGRFLYMAAQTNNATTVEHDLLAYDGTAWHKLDKIVENGAVYAMYYDPLNDRLWRSYSDSDAIFFTDYIPFQAGSEFPYAAFPTSGTHSILSSRLHMGYRLVKKSTPSLLIEGSNLSSTVYLKVFYSIDGGTWTAWGGEDGVTNVVNTDGVTELENPLGVSPSTLEYYYIQIKVNFITSSATSTPVLEGLTVRFLLRPDVSYGYSMTVIAGRGYEIGDAVEGEERTAWDIIQELREARDSKSPLEFVDPYGERHSVYISAINDNAVIEHTDEGGTEPDIEARVAVNLIEV